MSSLSKDFLVYVLVGSTFGVGDGDGKGGFGPKTTHLT